MNYCRILIYLCRFGLVFFMLLIHSVVFAASTTQSVRLRGSVVDEAGSPVAGLEVKIQAPSGHIQFAYTDKTGMFEFSLLAGGEYRLSLNKAGFFRLTDKPIMLSEGENEAFLTVNHETEIHEEVEVYSSSHSIQPSDTSHGDSLIAREIRDIPVPSTHDLRSSLQALPEVIRDHSGQLHIAGGRIGDTQYLLDGFDIGDPITRDLLARVNVDSVRAAEVESGHFGIQNGQAAAGVMVLDTKSGDDRWRAGATNFLPGIRVQRGLQLTSWYPRLRLSGPLLRGRAWFSEALSVQHTLSLIDDLPRDADSVSRWAGDNLLRVQVNLTPQNILQGSFLYNQLNASNLGLGPFSPISTTRDSRSYRSFFSLKDQVWSGRWFYEFGVAADFGHSETLPKGFEPYIVTPNGSDGNHFESLRQKKWRWQGFASITMPSRRWHGMHNLQFGFNAAETKWTHSSNRNVIQVIRADDTVVQHTSYSDPNEFLLTNSSIGAYGHDSWRVAKNLVLQFGFRMDWDRILTRITPSPRIAVNFLPFEHNRTKFTAAWGVYLQPLALSKLGPVYDQQRTDILYDKTGISPVFGPVNSRFVLSEEDLQQPRFYTTCIGWEQIIGSNSQIGIYYTQRNGRFGLAYERTAPDLHNSLFVLQNNRRDRYRSFQISLKHSFSDKAALSASYTRSSARTNRVFDYSLDLLVFAPQERGPMAWDAPNRFISSGWTPVPIWDLLLSYFFEYRTGFPFSIVNEKQQLIGPPHRSRFPDYVSLNLGIEKRIRLFALEWAVRLTILNITGRDNPNSIINNIDSQDFMKFAGGQKRAFSARLRLVE